MSFIPRTWTSTFDVTGQLHRAALQKVGFPIPSATSRIFELLTRCELSQMFCGQGLSAAQSGNVLYGIIGDMRLISEFLLV
jgi:hypothetical protein